MALEASDLNDGAIISATKQRNDEKGNIQFTITLPSGRVVSSEWISPENRKPAMMKWLDVIKDQVAADVQETQRGKIEKGKPRVFIGTTEVQTVVPAGTNIPQDVIPVTSRAEPIEFVRSQMIQAGEEVEILTKQLGQLRIALDNAMTRHQQWTTTHKALTGQESEDVKS